MFTNEWITAEVSIQQNDRKLKKSLSRNVDNNFEDIKCHGTVHYHGFYICRGGQRKKKILN